MVYGQRSGASNGLPGCRVKSEALSVTEDTFIDIDVRIDHSVGGEAALGHLSASGAVEPNGALHARDRRIDAVRENSGDAIIDDLRHRATSVRDDRRPAQHRLDDRQSERLRERNRVQETRRRSENLCALPATN